MAQKKVKETVAIDKRNTSGDVSEGVNPDNVVDNPETPEVAETNSEQEPGKETTAELNQEVQQTPSQELPEVISKPAITKEASKAPKNTDENKTSKEVKPSEADLPDEVKKVLKRFPDERELYVDKFGGVYTKDTQHSLVKNAILYKNPFYNK